MTAIETVATTGTESYETSDIKVPMAEWATVPITFERLGVTWDQVEVLDLPGTSPKKTYGYPLAVEAEALPPGTLRAIVEEAILQHLDQRQIDVLRVAEESERNLLLAYAEDARS